MAPGPGRIVWSRKAAFGRRYADGEPIASIKADPEFIAARAELSAAIFEGETA
jgi:taurine transport system ATP-binding protein